MVVSERTKRKLFTLSGNECAFPGCTNPIFDTEHGVMVGEICHIKARSPGGPRYDPLQSPEERDGFENLILMCASHNKIIDDPNLVEGFPVNLLVGYRKDHEARFHNTVVKPDLLQHWLTLSKQFEESAKVNISRLPITGANLFGRDRELKQLDQLWANEKIHVVSLVAWGGVGKSALINHWLAQMAEDRYRGALRVFAWSFYSQGTNDPVTTADQFTEAALIWFGDIDPSKGSPWDKGERLAQLVREERTLLVLDGLEPLQFPPGANQGRLKDQTLQSLLRGLAANSNGLCIISTREDITDLSSFENNTVVQIHLDHLSPGAGAELLRAQGVTGKQVELEAASQKFDGHSLALTLLGSYLNDVFYGDIHRLEEVKALEGDDRHGQHAHRVMLSYENWFGDGPELDILRILGLFNGPANKEAVDALLRAPAITGLTDRLRPLTKPKWQQVLARLRRSMLLSERDRNQPDTLDTHPMVRDHFRHRLKAQSAAWIAGHYRLYKHFTRKAKVFPDTVEEMTLLYDAIMHGCEAGRFQEVLEKVYIPRVSRREAFFSKRKLGSWSADLAALSHFFVVPWDQPVASLKTNYSAFILGEVGWALQAIGRMHEAASPTSAALEARLALSDWFNASATATNLSLIYQNLGDLVQAHYYATESVQFAVRSGFAFSRLIGKARLANTLHQMGRLPEAETLFDEAKTLIQTAEPRYPHLYSLWFYYYSTLLLDQRKYAEVEEIAVRELHSATVRDVVLDIALAYLALGHCQLLQFLEGQPGHVNEATANLIQATDKLRQAGVIEFKSLGLLIQAGLYRAKREFDHARANLDEVMTDTTISNLALQQADCHLEYAQLYLAQGESEKAGEHFNEGKKLIERIGYYRRTNNVEALGKQLNCFR